MDQQDERKSDGQVLDGLLNWMRFLSSDDRFYYRDGVAVRVYGQGDTSYAVFERDVSVTPPAVDQYVLHAAGPRKPLFSLVNFLADSDFKLSRVMDRISSAHYGETTPVAFGDIEISYYSVGEQQNMDKSKPLPAATAIAVKKRKLDKNVIAKADSFEKIAKSVSSLKQEQALKQPKPAVEEFDEWE